MPTIIRHYVEPPIQVDPSRLTWAPGYPSHDGSTRIEWHVWDTAPQPWRSIARLECDIVCDSVSHLVVKGLRDSGAL